MLRRHRLLSDSSYLGAIEHAAPLEQLVLIALCASCARASRRPSPLEEVARRLARLVALAGDAGYHAPADARRAARDRRPLRRRAAPRDGAPQAGRPLPRAAAERPTPVADVLINQSNHHGLHRAVDPQRAHRVSLKCSAGSRPTRRARACARLTARQIAAPTPVVTRVQRAEPGAGRVHWRGSPRRPGIAARARARPMTGISTPRQRHGTGAWPAPRGSPPPRRHRGIQVEAPRHLDLDGLPGHARHLGPARVSHAPGSRPLSHARRPGST